jgi:potassium/hydrogen antiporter
MVQVEVAFFTIALIIIIGYFGMIFFKKTKISELIILMLIGLLIGPIANVLGPGELAIFQAFLPFFAGFALLMILFEGGMQLNFFKAVRAFGNSFLFTIIVFILTLILVVCALWAISLFGIFPFDPLLSLLIGAIVGGTSSAVIIPLVNSTTAKDETKTLLSLESALTDALCVITAVAIAEIMLLGSFSLDIVGASILANFSIAAVMGLVFGLLWLNILERLQGKKYEYLMTLAVLLLLYSVVSYMSGNGAIAALVFGLVIGNSEDITRMLKLKVRVIDTRIKSFQSEISFLVKTFFFVYLGILFRFEFLTKEVILISSVVIVLVVISRFFGSTILKKLKPVFAVDQKLIVTMSARGLAAAVLVSLPVSMGLQIPPVVLGQITAIAFLVILLSNVLTTIGIFVTERGKPNQGTPEQKEEILKDIKIKTSPRVAK